MSAAYATVADYLTISGATSTSDETDAQIESLLSSAARQIDRVTGRTFGKDPTLAPTTRLYRTRALQGPLPYGWAESENPYRYGGWTRMLTIDDLVSVTSIKIDTDMDGSFADETALATTDYELWPNNALSGPEQWPYTAIYLPTNSATFGFMPGALIQVIGIFGWPAVPETIVRINCELVQLRRGILNPSLAGISRLAVDRGPSVSYSDVGRGALPQYVLDELRPYVRDASVV